MAFYQAQEQAWTWTASIYSSLEVMNTISKLAHTICEVVQFWSQWNICLVKIILLIFIPYPVRHIYTVLKANILFSSYKGPFLVFLACYCLSRPVRALRCHITLQQFTAQCKVYFTNIIGMASFYLNPWNNSLPKVWAKTPTAPTAERKERKHIASE